MAVLTTITMSMLLSGVFSFLYSAYMIILMAITVINTFWGFDKCFLPILFAALTSIMLNKRQAASPDL